MSGGLYAHHSFSPAGTLSPQMRSTPDRESHYLAELLAEHQKLGPFVQVLPICSLLLSQEIRRVSGISSNHGFGDYDRLQQGSLSPMASPNLVRNIGGSGLLGWSGIQHERLGSPQMRTVDWIGAPASPNSYIIKKILRLDIPQNSYPNFNFVGRLLGPRGNSLKRVEVSTGCRVYIRGKGSIKDFDKEKKLRGILGYDHLSDPLHILIEADLPANIIDTRLQQAQEILGELLKPVEEKLRGRSGYEHLSDPLHILVEAELPANIIDTRLRQAQEILEELLKPVDESQDYYKKQQLRELAILNSGLREDSPSPSESISPFNNGGMKRAKPGR